MGRRRSVNPRSCQAGVPGDPGVCPQQGRASHWEGLGTPSWWRPDGRQAGPERTWSRWGCRQRPGEWGLDQVEGRVGRCAEPSSL